MKASLASDTQYPETRRELSKLLGISQATLRTWDRLFREWLEAPVGQKGNATRKRYTPNDVRVFRIVKRRRDGGQTFAEIKSRLSADLLEDQLVDDVVMTTEFPPMTGRNALATRVYELELELTAARAQIKALMGERDQLRQALDTAEPARLTAEKEAAHALGQLEALQQVLAIQLDLSSSAGGSNSAEDGSGDDAKGRKKRNPPSWWRGFER
jgi:DNA-binding transcriptional MerR regulator